MSWDVVTLSLFLIHLMKKSTLLMRCVDAPESTIISLSSGLTVKVYSNLCLQSVASFVLQVRSANSENDVHKVKEHQNCFVGTHRTQILEAFAILTSSISKLGQCFLVIERRSQVADVLSSLDFSNPRHCTRWMVRTEQSSVLNFHCQKLNVEDVGIFSNCNLSRSLYDPSHG